MLSYINRLMEWKTLAGRNVSPVPQFSGGKGIRNAVSGKAIRYSHSAQTHKHDQGIERFVGLFFFGRI
jgi:hypothetical protein